MESTDLIFSKDYQDKILFILTSEIPEQKHGLVQLWIENINFNVIWHNRNLDFYIAIKLLNDMDMDTYNMIFDLAKDHFDKNKITRKDWIECSRLSYIYLMNRYPDKFEKTTYDDMLWASNMSNQLYRSLSYEDQRKQQHQIKLSNKGSSFNNFMVKFAGDLSGIRMQLKVSRSMKEIKDLIKKYGG